MHRSRIAAATTGRKQHSKQSSAVLARAMRSISAPNSVKHGTRKGRGAPKPGESQSMRGVVNHSGQQPVTMKETQHEDQEVHWQKTSQEVLI